jgi:hypothetical protein
MSYREVTKDDVGKECEMSFDAVDGKDGWHKSKLLFISDEKDRDGHNIHILHDGEFYVCDSRDARIRTSPLPDGWLPDDWRVLGDEETCQRGDYVVCGSSPSFEFCTEYLHFVDKGYVGMMAKDIVAGVSGNLCVIRPRYRPATKDDINKVGIGKHDDSALIKAIVERDNQGYDAWCLHKERGWCVARLSEMKVENEGWNVTN